LLALNGTCNASSGTCNVVNASTVSWTGTLGTGQSVTITYQAQIADGVATGTEVCIDSSVQFGTAPSTSIEACTTVNCPDNDPGDPPPAASAVSDQKAGSVLFYNLYTSSPTSGNAQNTRINITNTDPVRPVNVHLFFVDGNSCTPADAYICLTPNQTASFLASDIDPGVTGYLIAVAVDEHGCPINFNFLIGDEYVKLQSGHSANLGAEAFAGIPGGLPECDPQASTAVLNFDGVSYNQAPRVLALSSIPSRTDGNDTLLIINRLGGNLLTGAARLDSLFGLLYDDAEQPLSFTLGGGVCQLRASLSNNFPRTTPRFETVIPSGRTGWMKLWSEREAGLLGAMINFNPNAGTSAEAFNQGHNLHQLTLTNAASVTIPVFPPTC
jgi:hypothetical protein